MNEQVRSVAFCAFHLGHAASKVTPSPGDSLSSAGNLLDEELGVPKPEDAMQEMWWDWAWQRYIHLYLVHR